MILFWECVVACVIFTLIFAGGTAINQEAFLSEYAPKVQKRYLELHPEKKLPEKQKLTPGMVAAKLLVCCFFLAILTAMVYFAGADSFLTGFSYSCLIWTVVNLWDLLALDLFLFMRWKRVRLPGTETMDAEYRENVWPSVKGWLFGIVIGLPVCLACGGILAILR